jgi:hypothetical protein
MRLAGDLGHEPHRVGKDVWARCRSEMATIHVSVGSREDLVCRAQALVPALRSRAAEAGYPTSDCRSFHRPRLRSDPVCGELLICVENQ